MRIVMIAAGVLLGVAAITVEWTQRSEDVRAATTVVAATGTNVFSPQNITITAGDTVQWTVTGGTHTVTSDGSPSFPPSATLDSTNPTYSLLFNTAGVFTYYCTFHAGSGQYPVGMTGRITVQAAATATATNTAAAATATATRTPTRTTTGTPQATGTPMVTPAATVTAPAAIATPIDSAPINTTQPAGAAAPILGAPTVGDGSASQGGGRSHALSIALAALGAATIAAAVAVRRRA